MSELQHVSKLPHAPLQEVVFEARWKPDIDEATGREYDSEFELAQGKFAERLEVGNFLHHQRTVPEFLPLPLMKGNVVHQWRTEEGAFPIVQLGPCIVAVNQNGQGYEWENDFKPLIEVTLQRLIQSYRTIRFSELKLFYIDAIDRPESQSVLDQLKQLQFSLQFGVMSEETLEGANVELQYRLEHDSILQLSVRNATNNTTGDSALLWHTMVYQNDCAAWGTNENAVGSVMKWCEYAHSVTSRLFKQMTEGELYDSFL